MGLIDKEGKQITELKFDQVRPFRDRVAEGYFGADFVIIGDIGTISMSDPLNSRSFFHDGLGLSLKKGKYGFMNKAGKTVIKRRFTYAEDFSEGLAVVGVANARRGFIDVTGQLVIPPVFDEAQSFSDKLAAVKIDSRLVADDGTISASAIEEAKKNDPHASMTKTGSDSGTGTGSEPARPAVAKLALPPVRVRRRVPPLELRAIRQAVRIAALRKKPPPPTKRLPNRRRRLLSPARQPPRPPTKKAQRRRRR
ncbi:MAG: WG repeat-containing protein [Candidatus Competibacteraceae bacterium]|nr:WG repeat-containing protein [Candidatus Competibacteraceae bacterium]